MPLLTMVALNHCTKNFKSTGMLIGLIVIGGPPRFFGFGTYIVPIINLKFKFFKPFLCSAEAVVFSPFESYKQSSRVHIKSPKKKNFLSMLARSDFLATSSLLILLSYSCCPTVISTSLSNVISARSLLLPTP